MSSFSDMGGNPANTPSHRVTPTFLNNNYDKLVEEIKEIYIEAEQLSISVSTTNNSATYSTTKRNHLIKNIGTTSCYIDFDTTATTNSFLLKAKEILTFNGQADTINAITNSGTTELRIIGQK